jgi:cyclase
VLTRVLKMIREGKTETEATAAKPTADFDAKVPSANTTADRFVGQLYNDLKRSN